MAKIQLYVMLKLLSTHLDIADIYQRLHFGVFSLALSLSLSLFEKRRGIMLFQCVSCTVHGTHRYFILKKNFKTKSHNTIHTFKNYFTTVISVFSKVNGIQTDP